MAHAKDLESFLRGARIKECFSYICDKVEKNPSMEEQELYKHIENSGLFKTLGYIGIGVDIKIRYRIPGEKKKPDYSCHDEYQNTIFVIEAKRPSNRRLKGALPQLWERYVKPLRSKYGVLTNGRQITIYTRVGENSEPTTDINLAEATETQCDQISRMLRKPRHNIERLQGIKDFFAFVDKVSLKDDLAREDFLEIFKLKEGTIFGSLVRSLMDLFDTIYPSSKFLGGAYEYWRKSLAHEPEKVPDTWKPFLKKDRDILKFMFCLETAHAMLARLMLAKTCQDLQFPGIDIPSFILQKISYFRGQISIVAYPIVLIDLFKEMCRQLVYSIFEEDIFGWWGDAFAELSGKSSGELLEEKPSGVLESFSEATARLIFGLYKFDFSGVAGDPLGDLYQRYFDRETRKALGEFYTPVEVVDYILDAVDYKPGCFITNKRLIDPSCGSGTYLVGALKRYLVEATPIAKERGWGSILKELCNAPHIVGLDIHPFACLIAQIRFMIELVPYYKKAIEAEKGIYFLYRIPVYRTDSLLVEISPREKKTLAEDIKFPVELPVKANIGKSMHVDVVIPSWDKTAAETQCIANLDEYLCAIQAWFSTVKDRIKGKKVKEVHAEIIEGYLQKYLTGKDFKTLANFLKPYGDFMLNEMKRLQKTFGDGRLVKSIEDAALAALLKNYLQYDFVVGNPPYVRQESITEMKKELSKTYPEVYDGRADLYIYFYCRGIKWLNKQGTLGYISSNMFVRRGYGKKLTSYISDICNTKIFIDFGDSGVFSDVTNYPCILVIEKREGKEIPKYTYYVEVDHRPEEVSNSEILEEVRKAVLKNGEIGLDGFGIYKVRHPRPGETWAFAPVKRENILSKIEDKSTGLLREYRKEVLMGQQSNADKVHIIKSSVAKKYQLENGLLKPLVRGEGIRRWRLHWGGEYLIFPYKRIGEKDIVIPKDELIKRYPRTWHYFNQKERKKVLESRHYLMEKIREGARQEFYELWIPKKPYWFDNPKIITPDISNINNFAYDDSGYYVPTTGFIIVLKNGLNDKFYYLYFLGLLNSKTLEFYFKHKSPFIGGKYFRYNKSYLEQLPIKISQTPEEKIIADQIVQKVETILQRSTPERFIEGFPETYLAEYKSTGIEFDEVRCVFNKHHSRLVPFLHSTIFKGYNVYPDKDENPIRVETKEKAQYLILALKGKMVKQDDSIKIHIPKDNSIVIHILKKFETTMGEIERISMGKIEGEIDDLVYELYGLDEQDRKTIERFLEKF